MKTNFYLGLAAALNLAACVANGDTHNNYYGDCQQGDQLCAEQKIVDACTRTANRYPYSRDRLLLEEYADLVTEDAVFQIEGGPKLEGRAAIADGLANRGAANETRHFSQVVQINATGEDTAEGLSYVTVWSVDAQAFAEGRNTVTEPWVIGEYHDQFEMEAGTCRISNRLVKIVFQGKSY